WLGCGTHPWARSRPPSRLNSEQSAFAPAMMLSPHATAVAVARRTSSRCAVPLPLAADPSFASAPVLPTRFLLVLEQRSRSAVPVRASPNDWTDPRPHTDAEPSPLHSAPARRAAASALAPPRKRTHDRTRLGSSLPSRRVGGPQDQFFHTA